jgi:hypothetical protein
MVDRILDLPRQEKRDDTYERQRSNLERLLAEFSGEVSFYVNPSVMIEIERTPDTSRRDELLRVFEGYRFTTESVLLFPFSIPFSLPSKEDSAAIGEIGRLCTSMKRGDLKIIADALCNSSIDVLLIVDENHIANRKVIAYLKNNNLEGRLMIFTPETLYNHLKNNVRLPDALGSAGGT